jgi:hypothetical protein
MGNHDLFGWNDEREHGKYPRVPGHKGDLATGREAARKIAPVVKGIRLRVLNSYRQIFPAGMTADQAATNINLSILTVRPRCAELRRLGLLEATCDRRSNSSGHTAVVLRASRQAMEGGR